MTGRIATCDSSLTICDIEGPKSRVTNRYSPLVTRDLGPPKSRITSRGPRLARPPVMTCDLKNCIWLADLICGSRIAKHAKSQVTNSECRAAKHDSWLKDKSWSWLMVLIVSGLIYPSTVQHQGNTPTPPPPHPAMLHCNFVSHSLGAPPKGSA